MASSFAPAQQSRTLAGSDPQQRAFRPGYVAFGLAAAALLAAILFTDFVVNGSLLACLLRLSIMLSTVYPLRRLGQTRVALGIEIVALSTGFSFVAALLSLVLAASGFPFADALLARTDAILFGSWIWPTTLQIAVTHPRLVQYLSVIYDTLNLQAPILLALLLAAGKPDRARIFATAWMLTLGGTILISPLTPAVGTYIYHGVTPASVPGISQFLFWDHVGVLAAVRGGELRRLGMETLCGIVTFPSFHAGGAVLLGWGFYGVRLARWPFLVLNAAMFVSALLVGGHFVIDLLAGVAVSGLALLLARRIHSTGPARGACAPA